MTFDDSQFVLNPKYAINPKKSLEHLKSVVLINIDFDVQILVKALTIKLVLYKFEKVYNPYILNKTINLCKALKDVKKAQYHYLIQKMYSIIGNYSNALACKYNVCTKC